MIDLYSAPTMNGRRAAIALAECGLDHRIHVLDLAKGEQHRPEFLKLNPNGAIPVLVDTDGPVTLAQSGAITLYCGQKSGRLLPADPSRLSTAYEWFAQALTDVGPASSVLFQLSLAPEPSPANQTFFEQRFLKHCANADRQLSGRNHLADEFSIADVALYPIVLARAALIASTAGLDHLKAWQARIAARPLTAMAMATHG